MSIRVRIVSFANKALDNLALDFLSDLYFCSEGLFTIFLITLLRIVNLSVVPSFVKSAYISSNIGSTIWYSSDDSIGSTFTASVL